MNPATSKVRRHRDADATGRAAAEETVAVAREAVQTRGRSFVALSGGSTPRRLYELLAESPYRERIRWSEVELFRSDERAVDPDDPASNFRMAREALLQKVDVPPERIHRVPAERADLDAAAREYQRELARVFGVPEDGPPPRDPEREGVDPTDGRLLWLVDEAAASRLRLGAA